VAVVVAAPAGGKDQSQWVWLVYAESTIGHTSKVSVRRSLPARNRHGREENVRPYAEYVELWKWKS
jgi:hypothetical protein